MSNPFTKAAATVNVAATSTTGSVSLGTIPCQDGGTVRVYNAGPNTAFIEFGISTIEAAAVTSVPVPSGAIETFSRGPSVTHMAAITGTAGHTATVYATPGNGV